VRTGEEEPPPPAYRSAVRDVISHCLYGVDLNSLAVDLCKVALWIEGHSEGRPLTFLDHRIRCGNSLVGVLDLKLLEEGIPDGAYKAVTGDDKEVAKAVRKGNRGDRKQLDAGQLILVEDSWLSNLAQQYRRLEDMPEDTLAQRRRKEALHGQIVEQKATYITRRDACDLWTAAFFARLVPDNLDRVPRTRDVAAALAGRPVDQTVLGYARHLAERHRFFHWPQDFADVFEAGGFDVVLSNPPWDQMQFDPREFFVVNAPDIAQAPSTAKRNHLIAKLRESLHPITHRSPPAPRVESPRTTSRPEASREPSRC